METTAILFAVLLAVVGLRLWAGSLDGPRIREYLQQRGCKLLGTRWTPFGKGWLSEGTERIYEVEYEDAAGGRHKATVKTSMLTGVFFTDDVPVAARRTQSHNEVARLRAENERLRAQLQQRD